MGVLRKIAFGLLVAAAGAVVAIAGWELWTLYQAIDLRPNDAGLTIHNRMRLLQNRMDLLNRRVGDMEFLVAVLLGASSLYAMTLAASSYWTAKTFGRRADRTVLRLQDEIDSAMADLRRLQKDTAQQLRQAATAAVLPSSNETVATSPSSWQKQIAEIAGRLAMWRHPPLNEQVRMVLMQDETSAAKLEGIAPPRDAAGLAELYAALGRIYAASDAARSAFYLERALSFAPPGSALASEIHYQLACRSANCHDFPRAMRELTAVFEHQTLALDEKLVADIEEGGKLYELASTPPFDKAINDLLLNISIGTA